MELLILTGMGLALLIVIPFAFRANHWYQLGLYHGARDWRLIELDMVEQRLRETEQELVTLRQAYAALQTQLQERTPDEPKESAESII